ncbi:MAG: hypothetical protein AAF329_27695, partial [Cyanobacteria bacterium P01_A01_bin.17]
LQNQSPALSLVFLGMRSQPLPLGIWLVGAVVLGIFIGLMLLFLLNFMGTGPQPRRPRANRQPATSRPSSTAVPDWDAPPSNDWGTGDSSSGSDWGAQPAKPPIPPRPNLDDFSSVDEQRYARAGGTAPSTYSRSTQDPSFARQPGQRESVFEAEYRMVKPPGQEPPQPENWDELNDDFFEED